MRTPLGPAFENTYFIAFFQIKKTRCVRFRGNGMPECSEHKFSSRSSK